MKRFFSILVALLLLAFPARGQDSKVDTVPPGTDRIVSIKMGVEAPFEGQLFDNATALRWANWLRQYKLRLKVDVEEQQKLCTVRLDAASKVLDAEKARSRTIELAYEKRLRELQFEMANPPWYRSPTFYITVGVVGTVAAIVGGYAVGTSF